MSYDSWKLATPPEYEEMDDAEQPDNREITTWYNDVRRCWYACFGEYDLDVQVESGATEAEAIENLKESEAP